MSMYQDGKNDRNEMRVANVAIDVEGITHTCGARGCNRACGVHSTLSPVSIANSPYNSSLNEAWLLCA